MPQLVYKIIAENNQLKTDKNAYSTHSCEKYVFTSLQAGNMGIRFDENGIWQMS